MILLIYAYSVLDNVSYNTDNCSVCLSCDFKYPVIGRLYNIYYLDLQCVCFFVTLSRKSLFTEYLPLLISVHCLVNACHFQVVTQWREDCVVFEKHNITTIVYGRFE